MFEKKKNGLAAGEKKKKAKRKRQIRYTGGEVCRDGAHCKRRVDRKGRGKKKLESLNNTVSESEKLKEERKASVTEKNPQQDPC